MPSTITSTPDHAMPSTEPDRSAANWQLVIHLTHDINNLLGAIVGYSELLIEDTPAHALISPDLRRIHESAQGAAALVTALMTHARQARASDIEGR
jgi:signal transduction histidine kinase